MSFDINMTSPFAPGTFTGGLGGPGAGGHMSPDWYIQYGMDLAAPAGTAVYAAFDAHITRYTPHNPAADSGKVYGAQLFMRAPNEMMGGFYTHIADVPPEIKIGTTVALNDYLGTVYSFGGIATHLHLALVEIIGGLPGGTYKGVSLYQWFLDNGNSAAVVPITFMQDGSPPVPHL